MTKISRNRLYFDVVNSLTKPLLGTYAQIYFDNAYTSIPILHHLQNHQILACGTLRSNRKCVPAEIKKEKKKPEKWSVRSTQNFSGYQQCLHHHNCLAGY